MPGEPDGGVPPEEVAAAIREIRDRVRARYPNGTVAKLALPDLMPVLRARDAAQAKVASIGTVNPRAPGVLNELIQKAKRLIARALAWHVRDQVQFNRATVAAVEAILEALNENNRALADVAGRFPDADAHWIAWRTAFEHRLAATENEFLRTIAELKGSFDFRARQISEDIQRRLWDDLEKVRSDYERVIHTELRVVRQKMSLGSGESAAPASVAHIPGPTIDWLQFAERFRGPEEQVRERHRFYVPYFQGCRNVLDLGCGRGEFLELMRDAGISARGVDLSAEMTAICTGKHLAVEQADLFTFLTGIADDSVDGIFAAHVIEHLPPECLPVLVRTAAAKLRAGGVLALETPNPECLAMFSSHFYLDPTHVRPVPPALLSFYAEEAGFGRVEIHGRAPAVGEMPSLASVPEEFRNAFFGSLDYVLMARKL